MTAYDGDVAPDPDPIVKWELVSVTFDIHNKTSFVNLAYYSNSNLSVPADIDQLQFNGLARIQLLQSTSTAQPNENLLVDANGNPDLDAIYRGRIKPFLLANAKTKYPLM